MIHGGVDGHSQLIIYLQCSTNNTAARVLSSFTDAVQQYGLLDKVRTDLGGENVDVWWLMSEEHQSTSTVITGSFIHNERIEHLWNEVWRSVYEEFRCSFYQIEEGRSLEPLNETDIYCLHYVFVPRINKALSEFLVAWNNTINCPLRIAKLPISYVSPRSMPMLLSMPAALQLGGVASTNTSSPAEQSSISLPSVSSHVGVLRSTFKPCAIL